MSEAPIQRPLLAISLRLLAMVLLAAMMALIKIADARQVHIVETLFYRQLAAVPLSFAWITLTLGPRGIATARFPAHARRTVLGLIGMVFNFSAVIMLPLAEATAIGFSMPIFATLLAALLLREQVGIHRWSAVLVGFVGVIVIARPDAAHLAQPGFIIAILGAIMTALVSIALRDLGRSEPAPVVVFWFSALSLLPLALLMLWFGRWHDPLTWAVLAGMGLSGGLAQLCLTASLRYGPVSMVLAMDYSQIVWATLVGWLLFSTWPEPTSWIGAILIVASGLYIGWREHVRRRPSVVMPGEDVGGRVG
jgi:drug/metabolite transporter (DMT)-like permease